MNHYTILMMGHNSRPWIELSLKSALLQDYANFDVIAIDAGTNDGTYDYLMSHKENFSNLTVIRNQKRKFQTQNVYEGSFIAKRNSIIVTLDFDDWLPHNKVLKILDKYYTNDIWMTYGSMLKSTSGSKCWGFGRYSDDTISNNNFRNDQWRASHLRTFRRELILKIPPVNFLDTDGEWFKASGDLTFMWPMLEMSGNRFQFIPEPLYVYNEGNENSDFRKVPNEQIRIQEMLRSRPPFQRLEVF
jgi:glycosyltransferase involved in cell wall biosynthesis